VTAAPRQHTEGSTAAVPQQRADQGRRNSSVVPIRPDGADQNGRATYPGRPVPTTARQRITAVTDPADQQHGLWVDGVRMADLPIVRARMPVRDGAGKRRTWQYLLSSVTDDTAYLVSGKDLTSGDYADRVGINVPEDRAIRDAAVTVIRGMAEQAEQREATAGWVDGVLTIPPIDALPQGYLETSGTEANARAAWAEIAAIGCQPGGENLALNLGAAYAAPYPAALSKVRPVSFALVGVGQPRRGKSTNVNAAAGWYGAPLLLNPPISESAIAITDSLAGLGVLPFFRDENHAAKWTPEQWKQHWMCNLNGGGRRRSSADGSGIIRTTRGWWGIQWWSGNLDPRFGATDGVQARVIVLNDPHTPGKVESKRITALLGEAYGWPFRWQLADHATPDEMRELAGRAYADLTAAAAADGGAPEGSADTVAESLSLAVAGAELAGEMFGVAGLRAAAVRAALRVLRTLTDTMADQATAFGDQLLRDVMDDVQRNPGAWPAREDYEAMRRERASDLGGRISRGEVHGFRHVEHGRDVVSMLRGVFVEMTTGRDYALGEALSELKARQLLVADRGSGNQHQVKINGVADRFYTFRVGGVVTEAGNNVTGGDVVTDSTPAELGSNDGNDGNDVIRADTYVGGAGSVAVEPPPTLPIPEPGTGPCVTCRQPGEYCGFGEVTDNKQPCVLCGIPTAIRSACGAARTGVCRGPEQPAAPEVPPAVPAAPAPAQRRGASPAAGSRAGRQAERLAADIAALDEGRPVRVLSALETTHAPLRRHEGRMHQPYWRPELPGITGVAHVVTGWHWSREYAGEVAVLDRSGAWVAAASSATVAHGPLVHTGPLDEFEGRPGMYKIPVYPWHEADTLPHPLGHVTGDEVWVPAPTVVRLAELVEQNRWPDVAILDSYTADGVRLNDWTTYVNKLRAHAIRTHGRDSDQYAEIKMAFGQALSLLLGSEDPGRGRVWKCKAQRPDWSHTIQAQASAILHRWADRCRIVAPDLGPVMVRNVDELVIPAAALEIVTTVTAPGAAKPLALDPEGIKLGTFKVKATEVAE